METTTLLPGTRVRLKEDWDGTGKLEGEIVGPSPHHYLVRTSGGKLVELDENDVRSL